MACHMCSRNNHCQQTFNGIPNCDAHYSDVSLVQNETDNEPEAPTLSLGNRILWLTESRAASGIVRWIGRIPAISNSWSAGVEFDNVMLGGGNGYFRGKQYFQSRIGHALFLPVFDLLKVDSDNSGNGATERTSFFGRLQDSCSNFAHRRRRDSTFGHYKQDYCSNCVQNDFGNYSHYCHRPPVYDRITTRRSVCFDDHPYEMYNACVPCGIVPNTQNHYLQEKVPIRGKEVEEVDPHVEDVRIPVLRHANRVSEDHHSDNFPRFGTFRRESIFAPSLSLINGFKEWVTCFILGTNRRKKKNKIVFKDRKSVTSVFIAQNGQSLTGQRLSSFADYASVTVNRASNQNIAVVKDNGKKDINVSAVRHNSQPKVRYRKKRPAPLPPIQHPDNTINGNKINDVGMKKDTKNAVNLATNEVVKPKETKFKIVRSSSIKIHSVPRKQRKRKKRKAPPPPAIYDSVASGTRNKIIPFNNTLSGSSVHNVYEKKDDKLKYQKVSFGKNKLQHGLSNVKSNKKARNKLLYQHVQNNTYVGGYSDSGQESGSEGSNDSSNSLSFSEDDSDDEKYGVVKYGIINKTNSSENSLDLPGSSNFVQYADDSSDVCLKISIQKTETNVVTVEEVTSPLTTTHYTIEEDTSSELSDVPSVKEVDNKAITYPELKPNSADSASISTVEEPSDKSKTIFEELQMKPPVKGSVKDFVNAFNMLANKSNIANFDRNNSVFDSRASSGDVIAPKICIHSGDPAEMRNRPKDFQSSPTNWEYQTKASNVIYASNKFLLPIAEESHNDTSEHDGNVSVDDSKTVLTKIKSCTASSEIDNSSKKCSHCFETHAQSSNINDVHSKGLKKRIAPRKDRKLYESVKPLKNNTQSTQASMAALSSLLQGKVPGDLTQGKLANSSSSIKNNSKLDQPIMVGLYIEDKSSHRGPIPLLVTPSMSLKKLKKQIEKEYQFPKHQQCWILGESFAVADEASLASYGVNEPGCPVLLYVMANDSKSHSLPARASLRVRSNPLQDCSDSSEEEVNVKQKGHKKISVKSKQYAIEDINEIRKQTSLQGAIPKFEKSYKIPNKVPPNRKRGDVKSKKIKSEFHKKWEKEFEKKADYHTLLALDDVDLVANVEKFECSVCFLDVEAGEGATLQECLHSFCKECLAGAIQFSDTAVVKCPFRNDEYSCESHLQEREVKSLVTREVYERHLQRSMALAESQAQDSFHCKTPDCPGWCLFEDNVNTFLCPVCKRTNCLTCAAIHEGKNCRQYQDDVAFRCDSSEEARKTKEYLQSMVDNGEAMRCPKCQVILMKKWGCDWLKCSMCHIEVCWVTKGPRWGSGGRGDTSGGCKCMVNGVRCHPKCSYCH